MHIHILGICGTLMGSIALLAKAQGHTITGSDDGVYPPMSDQLRLEGIALQSPYGPDSVPGTADLVVLGNAGLGRGNPAVEALLSKGTAFCSGAEFLGRFILKEKMGDRGVWYPWQNHNRQHDHLDTRMCGAQPRLSDWRYSN